MLRWSEVKEKVKAQMGVEPQRATLATQAIQKVEEGLSFLAGAGYSFELAPKGTYAELSATAEQALQLSRTLSIKEGQELVSFQTPAQPDLFEAR